MASDLLTSSDVAEALHVSPSTVNRWARDGLIPAVRLPGGRSVFRFSKRTIDRILAGLDPAEDEAAAS